MQVRERDMFGVLYTNDGDPSAPPPPGGSSQCGTLAEVAREFSPRIEVLEPAREVVLDLAGLTRLFGDAQTIAAELRRTAADRALRVRVAVAGTRTAARLLVRHYAGLTVIATGAEAEALAPLRLELLAHIHRSHDRSAPGNPNDPNDPNDVILALRRWGLRTLGALAALSPDDVAARLGQHGVRWQRVACGEDLRPLIPSVPEDQFEQAIDLEWPIEGLEPLSFVLGRLLEPLSAHLERRDRGAAVLYLRLHLVTRDVHERSLQLPAPMREARTLRTLLLLDLESHPPPAAIDRVVVSVDPTPGRVVQFSLLTRPLPSPEQLSTLMARLQALMGAARCGAPAAVDSWEPGAFAMKTFAPVEGDRVRSSGPRNDRRVSVPPRPVGAPLASAGPVVALRRFRLPVIARVHVQDDRPVRVTTDRAGVAGGRVASSAGPWRTSGAWWRDAPHRASAPPRPVGESGWDRDEWDVTLGDGATYRIFRERGADRWFVEGIVD